MRKMARYNLNDRLTGERVTIHNGEGEKEPIQQQPAVADSLVECYPNPTYFEAQWGKNCQGKAQEVSILLLRGQQVLSPFENYFSKGSQKSLSQ